MSAQEKVKTRCPTCQSAYYVPSTLVGHRARCPKCSAVFRVAGAAATRPDDSPPPVQASPPETPRRRATEQAPHPSSRPRSPNAKDVTAHGVSEDDIVRWLTESESDDLPPEPRRWMSPPKPAEQVPA